MEPHGNALHTPLAKRLTARDLDRLPHEWDTRYELVGGELFMSRRPSFEHQEIIARLLMKVGPVVLAQGGRAVTEPGIVWEDDGDDNVSPDLALLLRTPPPSRGEKLRRCPEVVVEVLSSEESRWRDLEAKRQLYWRRGAVEYWIVDPDERALRRLTRGGAGWIEEVLRASDRLHSPLLDGWQGVAVSELFPSP